MDGLRSVGLLLVWVWPGGCWLLLVVAGLKAVGFLVCCALCRFAECQFIVGLGWIGRFGFVLWVCCWLGFGCYGGCDLPGLRLVVLVYWLTVLMRCGGYVFEFACLWFACFWRWVLRVAGCLVVLW